MLRKLFGFCALQTDEEAEEDAEEDEKSTKSCSEIRTVTCADKADTGRANEKKKE